MLIKLLKHEYIYIIRKFTPLYILYLAMSLIIRIISSIDEISLDNESTALAIGVFIGIITSVYFVLFMGLLLIAMIDNVKRFKTNMFSDEGYLTNTLPVTSSQHILAKIIAGASCLVLSFIVMIAGVYIISEDFSMAFLEIFFDFINNDFLSVSTKLSISFLIVIGYVAFMLFCYFLEAVSSMMGHKRIYAGLVGSVLIIINSVISFNFTKIFSYIDTNDNDEFIRLISLTNSLYYGIVAVVLFFVTSYIMKKRLNLQ